MRLSLILAFVLGLQSGFVGNSAHAEIATPADLPADYATWQTLHELSCEPLSIKVYSTITPDAEMELLTYTLGKNLVAYSMSSSTNAGKVITDHGLYKGEWKSVDGTDANKEKSERLVNAALLDNGGQPALVAFGQCKQELVRKIIKAFFAPLGR